MEVEGEAEVSVVEFGKKNEEREQASHRKRKSRKMKRVKIKIVLKKGG